MAIINGPLMPIIKGIINGHTMAMLRAINGNNKWPCWPILMAINGK